MNNKQEQSTYHRTLSTGVLTVTPTEEKTPIDKLFDIAERRNPKRAFLFVSKVLGRHIPVEPSVMRSVYQALAQKIPVKLPEPVLFIGMAETAVGLAAGVYQEASHKFNESVFLTSTRHPMNATLLCEFKENHSHATDHLIYWPTDNILRQRVEQAKSIVLIDDEATTGNTFLNLLSSLQQAGLNKLQHVVAVTLTDWSGDALAQSSPLPISSVSLVKGTWHWQPNETAAMVQMPAINVTAQGKVAICGKQNWGRLGMTHSQCDLATTTRCYPNERILVLGSSEFVWQPFLLAECLEKEQANVKFASTTRSPIALGHAIQSAMAFTDNYGLGIPNFLYNVAHQQFDRILLCSETPESAIDPLLIEQLYRVAPIVEIIIYA